MALVLPTVKSIVPMQPKDNIMLYYGPPGVGKTTFVNDMADKTLFLSTDRGTRYQEALRIECMAWEKFEKVIEMLGEKGAPKYDIVCIDHVDDWASMAEDKVCEEMGIESLSDAGYGKAWKAYRKCMETQVRAIMKLGCGIVFIAHENIQTIKAHGIESQRFMPAMSKSAWKVIIPMSDIVGYAGFRVVKVAGKDGEKVKQEVRILQTQPTEQVYAKDRTSRTRPQKGWELLNGKKFIETFNTK